MGYGNDVSRLNSKRTHTGLKLDVGVPGDCLIQAKCDEACSLVVVRHAQSVWRSADLEPATSHIVGIDKRQAILLVRVERVLKFKAETIRRVGRSPRDYPKRGRLIRGSRDSCGSIRPIAKLI